MRFVKKLSWNFHETYMKISRIINFHEKSIGVANCQWNMNILSRPHLQDVIILHEILYANYNVNVDAYQKRMISANHWWVIRLIGEKLNNCCAHAITQHVSSVQISNYCLVQKTDVIVHACTASNIVISLNFQLSWKLTIFLKSFKPTTAQDSADQNWNNLSTLSTQETSYHKQRDWCTVQYTVMNFPKLILRIFRMVCTVGARHTGTDASAALSHTETANITRP